MPQLDFASFLLGVVDGKAEVARDIGTACQGIGFFRLTGHGIPAETTDGIFSAARQILTLPVEHKTDPDLLISREHNRGYQLVGARCYEKTSAPDLMVAFKYQWELAADDPDILAGDRIQQMNKWPANLPGWRERLLDYSGLRAVPKTRPALCRVLLFLEPAGGLHALLAAALLVFRGRIGCGFVLSRFLRRKIVDESIVETASFRSRRRRRSRCSGRRF